MSNALREIEYRIRPLVNKRRIIAVTMVTLALGLVAGSADAGWRAGGGRATVDNPEAAGRWAGNVQIPGAGLRLVIDLAQNNEGRWVGSAIVPGFGVKGAALTDIAVNGPDVAFAIKGVLGDPKLKGRIYAKGQFVGDYQEAGNTAAFILEKTGPPQVEPPRRSTPVQKELEGEWQGEFELPGRTLSVRVALTNQAGGPAMAKIHFKGKNDYDIPVDYVTEEDNLLTLESPSANFIYQGWFHRDTNEIKGELQVGPYDVSLVLHPAAYHPAEQK